MKTGTWKIKLDLNLAAPTFDDQYLFSCLPVKISQYQKKLQRKSCSCIIALLQEFVHVACFDADFDRLCFGRLTGELKNYLY